MCDCLLCYEGGSFVCAQTREICEGVFHNLDANGSSIMAPERRDFRTVTRCDGRMQAGVDGHFR